MYELVHTPDDRFSAAQLLGLRMRAADLIRLHIAPQGINMADSVWMREVTLGQAGLTGWSLVAAEWYYNPAWEVGHSFLLHQIKERALAAGLMPTENAPDEAEGLMAVTVCRMYASFELKEYALRALALACLVPCTPQALAHVHRTPRVPRTPLVPCTPRARE